MLINRLSSYRAGHKATAFLLCLLLALAGCSTTGKHQQAAQEKAQQAGMAPLVNPQFDGTFIAQGVNFRQYRQFLVEPLNMEETEIVQPSARDLLNTNPWTLKPNDKTYYQERYSEALIKNLVGDGAYSTAVAAGSDVLLLRARILQIAPLASKDDWEGRPGLMKVYSEGMGTMTIEMTLYDSLSGKAVAIITDRRELGRLWEENNRITNNIQVRLAFDNWLRKLRNELDSLRAQ